MSQGDLATPRPSRLVPPFAITFAFVVVVGGSSVYLQKAPEVVPSTAPTDVFSADRAMEHMRAMASQFHPTGSFQAEEVRTYVVEQLRKLGLNPEVQKERQPTLENIIGVLPGRNPVGPAVMLAAHYDSVATGPGAGDDAAGVAAILEAVRAVKAGPPLDDDLIVLITDGEEAGMLGAEAFVKHKEWVDRVGVVLNFEGRGNRGPSFMFETSDKNGWLIRQFAAAHPHPLATSLAYSIYKLMPNNTDLTVFKNAGLKGLNFAFVEGVENYHQPTDTPENLDLRSLQHHGVSALSLARHFGRLDLTLAASESDAIYFHVMGPHLLVYPGSLVTPLMFAAVAAFALVIFIGLRPEGLTIKGIVIGAGVSLLAVVLATAVCWASYALVLTPLTISGRVVRQDPVHIAEGLTAAAMVVAWVVCLLARRRIKTAEMAVGGLFWWLVLTVAGSSALQGGSYLFLWPVLFGLIGLGLRLMFPRRRRIDVYVGSMPALILVPPTLHALCVALGPSLPYAGAPLAALLVIALGPLALQRHL